MRPAEQTIKMASDIRSQLARLGIGTDGVALSLPPDDAAALKVYFDRIDYIVGVGAGDGSTASSIMGIAVTVRTDGINRALVSLPLTQVYHTAAHHAAIDVVNGARQGLNLIMML
jgi:hypothetical protein